jgi:hypothetical protein
VSYFEEQRGNLAARFILHHSLSPSRFGQGGGIDQEFGQTILNRISALALLTAQRFRSAYSG